MECQGTSKWWALLAKANYPFPGVKSCWGVSCQCEWSWMGTRNGCELRRGHPCKVSASCHLGGPWITRNRQHHAPNLCRSKLQRRLLGVAVLAKKKVLSNVVGFFARCYRRCLSRENQVSLSDIEPRGIYWFVWACSAVRFGSLYQAHSRK